jgi:CDP-diglyceride synthetase
MELEIILLSVIIFLLAWGWLVVLRRRVSPQEARFITIKYFAWIPIIIYFLVLLLAPTPFPELAYSIIFVWGLMQIWQNLKNTKITYELVISISILLCASLVFYYIRIPTQLLALVIIGSVLSDVGAYSFSKISKTKHFFPEFINNKKTYEGVVGGLLGPIIALLILRIINIQIGWEWAVIIGLASNLGDAVNSMIKRLLKIKDWGRFLPSHGGVFDRFASFYLSYAAVALVLQNTGLLS